MEGSQYSIGEFHYCYKFVLSLRGRDDIVLRQVVVYPKLQTILSIKLNRQK